jgi:starch synthase (maltosyl-transferring)
MPKKNAPLQMNQGRRRVIIERVSPEIDGGRFPIKRVPGEPVEVQADIFADGHDVISAVLLFRSALELTWTELPMEPLANDRWRAIFRPREQGTCAYTVEAWLDHFKSWQRDLGKKTAAGQDVTVELQVGSALLIATAQRATGSNADTLRDWAAQLAETAPETLRRRIDLALSETVTELATTYPDRSSSTFYAHELRVTVDPLRARYGAWYELFPRSFASEPGAHGTFRDCEAQLPRISEMGFDVLYLPPIHPIGTAFRKGKNNNPTAEPGEPGSPWGIGSREGGHKAVHPQLGTLETFRHLVEKARQFGLELAMDIAFQCSPDHPYVREHPEWFIKRPDGSIQYAENPPKKYQDIYPLNFETEHWEELWEELKSVFEFWIAQGVLIFRVDNPHTKSLRFWEWLITEIKIEHPEAIFLSEAFTRPKLMYYLAKTGFSQSYNYFPWRNSKEELTEYLTEVTRTEVREYFRPNLWPNTPDILPQSLQAGGRPAFMSRFILAATLGASYGIYGPAYELCENTPRVRGAEEYINSEKYEIKKWDLNAPGNITGLIAKTNQIRKENTALHSNDRLLFHPVDNTQLIAYSKHSEDFENIILTVVNLDPHHTQSGWVELAVDQLKIPTSGNYQVHDLLTGARYLWSGMRNYVELNPSFFPAHVFRIRRKTRSERDFDYYL